MLNSIFMQTRVPLRLLYLVALFLLFGGRLSAQTFEEAVNRQNFFDYSVSTLVQLPLTAQSGNYFRSSLGMYSHGGGNFLSTDVSNGRIDYWTVLRGDSGDFGPNGRYITHNTRDYFVLSAELDSISYFQVDGGIEDDAARTVDTTEVVVTAKNGRQYKAFFKMVTGGPSNYVGIHQVMVVELNGSNANVQQEYSTEPTNAFHKLVNLETTERLYYLMFTTIQALPIPSNELEPLVQTFVDNLDVAPKIPGSSWYSPVPQSTGAALDGQLSVTFDQPIQLNAGVGDITINVLGGSTVETIPVDIGALEGDKVSVSGNTLIIKPDLTLQPNTMYWIGMDSAVVSDASGNPFDGWIRSSIYLWYFTTTDDPKPVLEMSIDGRSLASGDTLFLGELDAYGLDTAIYSRVVTVKNTGTTTLKNGLLGVTNALSDANVFGIVSYPGRVRSGDSAEMKLRVNTSLNPTEYGTYTYSTDDPVNSPFVFTTQANFLVPEMSILVDGQEISPGDTIDFGTVQTGSESTVSLTLKNAGLGTSESIIFQYDIGDLPPVFELSDSLPDRQSLIIGAHSERQGSLSFAPTEYGEFAGVISVNNGYDPINTDIRFYFKGEGQPTVGSVLGRRGEKETCLSGCTAFGETINLMAPLGQAVTETLQLYNPGTEPLILTGLTTDVPAGFTLIQFPDTVSPGDTATFHLQYLPQQLDTNYLGTITFTVNADDISEITLNTRTGIAAGGGAGLPSVRNAFEQYSGQITALIPERFDFEGGETGTQISNGGEDMFSNGNKLWIESNSPGGGMVDLYPSYTQGNMEQLKDGGNYPVATYFTRKVPGLFFMAMDLENVESFNTYGGVYKQLLAGSLHSSDSTLPDGRALPGMWTDSTLADSRTLPGMPSDSTLPDGRALPRMRSDSTLPDGISDGLLVSSGPQVDKVDLTYDKDGVTYRAMVRRHFGSSAPGVVHMFIIEEDTAVSHTISTNVYSDNHGIAGLSGSHRLYYLLFGTQGGRYLTDNEAQAIFEQTVDLFYESGPTIQALSPVSGATEVALDAPLSIALEGVVSKGVGHLVMYKSLDKSIAEVATWNVTDPAVTLADNTLTLPFAEYLELGQSYFISVDSGTLVGNYGSLFSGIDNDRVNWSFRATATTPEIAVLLGGTGIANGTGQVSLPDSVAGDTTFVTLTIENTGNQDLVLSDLSLPTGFTATNFPATVPAGQSQAFQVSLAGSAGTYSGSLSFSTNDVDEADYSFMLSGKLLKPATLAVLLGGQALGDSSALDFGNTQVGSNATQTLTLQNTGEVALTLSDLQISVGFLAEDLPQTLEAGASVEWGLFLDASSISSVSGSLSFTTNDASNLAFRLNLEGEVLGIATLAVIAGEQTVENGDGFDLGSTTIGTSHAKSITLTNTGSAVLTLEGLDTPTGYSVSNFPDTLDVGDSTLVTIILEAHAVGSFADTLSFATNDPEQPTFALSLTGEVLGIAQLAVKQGETELQSGDDIDFGTTLIGTSVITELTLSNTGSAALNLANLTVSEGFSLSDLPASLAVGAEIILTLTLLADVVGTPTGMLSFETNDPHTASFQLGISGIVEGIPQLLVKRGTAELQDGDEVNLGATTVGTPVATQLTLTNTGSAVLNLSNLIVPEGFSFSGLPATLAVGADTVLTLTLLANTVGVPLGTLAFGTNDPNAHGFSLNVSGTVAGVAQLLVSQAGEELPTDSSLDFGTTPVGREVIQTLSIENTGSADLLLSEVVVPAGYLLIGLPDTIPAGSSAEVTLALEPLAVGTASGEWSFATNDPDASLYLLSLTGVVIDVPQLVVSWEEKELANMDSLLLGNTEFGTSISGTLRLTNVGKALLELSDWVVPTGFTTSTLPATLGVGEYAEVTVTLEANIVGEANGTLTFTTNVEKFNSYILFLNGKVTGVPQLAVTVGETDLPTGNTLDFGSLQVGDQGMKTLILANTGTAAIENLTIQVNRVDFGVANVPSHIEVGDSAKVVITFSPEQAGDMVASLSLKGAGIEWSSTLRGKGDIPSSLRDNQDLDIQLYPNPTQGRVTLNFPLGTDHLDFTCSLIDPSGREYLISLLDANDHQLDLGRYPSGVYWLRITTPEGVTTRRIVKE